MLKIGSKIWSRGKIWFFELSTMNKLKHKGLPNLLSDLEQEKSRSGSQQKVTNQ